MENTDLSPPRERGFTLIELLIVIVILGILSAIVVFSVNGITDRGENSACQANVETVNIASEAYRAQNTGYAATLPALQSAGFLKTIPGTVAGDGLSFAVANAGGSGYTVSYDPATGLATSTCPAGSTGGGGGGTTTTTAGGGGGGGGTTTTTTTLGPCTFGSFTPTTVDVDSNGALTQSYTFTVNLTGNCAPLTGVNATIDRNGSGGFGGSDGPRAMAAVGGSGNTQWTIAMSSWGNDWDSNDSGSEGTPGTVAVQITFSGPGAPSTVNSSLTLTNNSGPCVVQSYTPSVVVTEVAGGGSDNGTIPANTTFTVNLSGNCSSLTDIDVGIDRDDDGGGGGIGGGDFFDLNVVSGTSNRQWTGTMAPLSGWDETPKSVNIEFELAGISNDPFFSNGFQLL
jgi:prepilin-type N-terminal cleavage/methylation domain-containing protein